jgi:hypothetical protein
MGDQWVKLSDGRVMTYSQYQAMVNQAVSTYTQQMTVAIDQLSSLQDQMYVHSGDVSMALSTLQSDMAGIDHAIGTDDQGQKFRSAWNSALPDLERAINGVAQALISVGDGLGTAADAVYTAEEQTLESFDKIGFHFRAVDPRWHPSGPGRTRAF